MINRENAFAELVKRGEEADHSDHTAPRLVVLVRDDILPPIHQGIQAMHSVIHLAEKVKIDPRCYIYLLGATDNQINHITYKVFLMNKHYAYYSDPGLVDASGEAVWTACAFEPMPQEETRKYFGGLRRAS